VPTLVVTPPVLLGATTTSARSGLLRSTGVESGSVSLWLLLPALVVAQGWVARRRALAAGGGQHGPGQAVQQIQRAERGSGRRLGEESRAEAPAA
jgi:hypothetical protein